MSCQHVLGQHQHFLPVLHDKLSLLDHALWEVRHDRLLGCNLRHRCSVGGAGWLLLGVRAHLWRL